MDTQSDVPVEPLQVQREITLHARMIHPNIIRLYAAFQDAEGIYLVMVSLARQQAHALSVIACTDGLCCSLSDCAAELVCADQPAL